MLAALFLFFPSVSFCDPIQLTEWDDLSDKKISADGQAALQIKGEIWKHAETEHFIYHFRDEKQAQTVTEHAEAYYQWVKQMFGVESDDWPTKSQVYIFEDKNVWREFNKRAGERLPGAEAYTDGTDLFIYRESFFLSPQKTLAHEITHIVAYRFIRGTLPLFLNEGFAEFMSYKAVALQADGNDYAHRTVKMIEGDDFIALGELCTMRSYPANEAIFYRENELLVRYLILTYGKEKFYDLLRRSASGESFQDSLNSIYSMDLETFEATFRAYAVISHPS